MDGGSGGAQHGMGDAQGTPADAFGTPGPDLDGADSMWSWVSTIVASPFIFLQNYGWLVVGVILLCYLLWTRVRDRFYDLYDRTMERRDLANTDEAQVIARQNAQAAARERMQQDLDERARAFVEKQKVNEERKRQEKLEDWDRHQRGDGYRSRVKKTDGAATADESKPKKKRTLRDNDYNPLMGDSSGGSGGAFRRASGRHTFRSSGGG